MLYAKPSYSTIQNNNSQTEIKSRLIKIIRKSGKINFIDNASIENGDTSILADKIVVFYDESKNSTNSINKADAIGNVKIFNDEFVVTGSKGFYRPGEETFTMVDDVIFNNGTSISKGEKFIYNLVTKRGFLVGGDKNLSEQKDNRVIVIINESNE